jgi:hypothetical protein
VNEPEARRRLDETGAAIVAGVERCLPAWSEQRVDRILDAWGRLDRADRARVTKAGRAAGAVAATRISGELRTLFAAAPAEQQVTPLEVVRTAYREPTAVLAAAGAPPVVRDEFDERAWPADVYGFVPRSLGDLGDEELGPLLLAWGLAKAAIVRPRPVA